VTGFPDGLEILAQVAQRSRGLPLARPQQQMSSPPQCGQPRLAKATTIDCRSDRKPVYYLRKNTPPWAGFPSPTRCDIINPMNVGVWLCRLLPILAIVGLVAGPFTPPVNGAAMAASCAMSEMPANMPCCPHDKPAVPDCQKTCPLMATCMANCFPGAPMLSSQAVFFMDQSDALGSGTDVAADALTIEPPARPPRI